MESHKKRVGHRLSSIFSTASAPDPETSSVVSSGSAQRHSSASMGNRLSSAQHLAPPSHPPPPPPKHDSSQSPSLAPVDSAPAVLQPPPPMSTGSRSSSPMRSPFSSRPSSRPSTPVSDGASSKLSVAPEAIKRLKRKSRIFGSASTASSEGRPPSDSGPSPPAWIVGHHSKVPYDLSTLINGEKVPELWDSEGDTYVYLFPRNSGKGPSFRIDSAVYSASQYMTRLVHGRLYSESNANAPRYDLPDRTGRSASGTFASSRTTSPDLTIPQGSSDGSNGSRALSDATEDVRSEVHMFLPLQLSIEKSPAPQPSLSSADVETLVVYRNFIAFLVGQSLIATQNSPSIFDVFLRISDILGSYQFSNLDGSTFGEVALASFESYVEELQLADVRSSREKTIEAIVLGEKMRCISLYTEGFVHGVGKFEDMLFLNHAKWALVTPKTQLKMSRASMDLDNRINNINIKLKDFEFKAIFSGIMNSDTAEEGKIVKFKAWKASFMAFRSHVYDYYKAKYGSWLPKASSKKNSLSTSGLNRLVLRDLYDDFSSLYDLLVDRTNLTTRVGDEIQMEDPASDIDTVTIRALRRVLVEYDSSTPPVSPPMPFDVPLYPTLKTTRKDFPSDPKKADKLRTKKLKDDEITRMLQSSRNMDAERPSFPFLEAFQQFEMKQAHQKTMNEIWDLRSGHWLFLYAVLQSLPMLVVDAPGLQYTDGVEYFLCEPPRSGLPWLREDTGQQRSWFGVAGGSHVVNLPTDVVEHSVEAVYRRSHCWEMAAKWTQNDTLMSAAVQESLHTSLPPPPGFSESGGISPRSRSQSMQDKRGSVMDLGLEALPLPSGIGLNPASSAARPASTYDPNKTFDSILQSVDFSKPSKKKK